MAETIQTDIAVVGSGPGGYAAAFLAADKGKKAVLIDAAEKPGGACLHVGCIPSKSLLHAAKLITDAREAAGFGIHFDAPRLDIAALRTREFKIVDGLAKNLLELCKRRKVDYLKARATFENSSTLRLDNGNRVQFQHCILATGSSPARIPTLALDSPRVMDSTAALRLEEVPRSLLVVGGGYIGLELGSVYAALGSKVTVVELTDGLLPGVDRDLVRPLQARLTSQFEKIYLATKVVKIEEVAKGIRASLEGDEVTDKQPIFERVLVSVGRKPNTRDLGLENTRVQLDEKGFVKVDERRRTTDDKIFAIGDIAGEPMLAHKASHEGKVAVEVILGEPALCDWRAVPAVVFTDPEIAWCGLTETEARKQKREVKAARFPWAASGRAVTLGRTDGLTKLLVDPQTEQVLGVGIVGESAGELIGEAVLAIEMGATARDLAMIIHAHPTLSESVGEAADMLYGTATHLLRTKTT
jgi:dihydrolipoamide dehydrogenase